MTMVAKTVGGSLAAALLLLGAGCAKSPSPSDLVPPAGSPPYNTAPVEEMTKDAAAAPAVKRAPAKAKAVTPTAPAETSRPYSEVVSEYSQGARFQFSNCHASPGSLSIKQGQKLMLDNRDAVAHKIMVGPATYNVSGYGYNLITVNNPGQQTITCDGGGVGYANVQP